MKDPGYDEKQRFMLYCRVSTVELFIIHLERLWGEEVLVIFFGTKGWSFLSP